MRAEGQVSGRREGEELGPLGPAELITSGPRLCEERGPEWAGGYKMYMYPKEQNRDV